jgi:hypothetical protein
VAAVKVEVYVEGNKLITRATFKIESVAASGVYNTLANPATVTFTAKRRNLDGIVGAGTPYVVGTAPEATQISTGIYEFAHIPTPGRWWVHVQGVGTVHGAGKVVYDVAESEALAA